MSDARETSPQYVLAVRELARRKETRFNLEPDAQMRGTIAQDLDLAALRKLKFTGTIAPKGAEDWTLSGQLGATVEQRCIVTLEPVTTRIDAPVIRRFVAQMPQSSAPPSEDEGGEDGALPMLEDDTLEPLGGQIDLVAVLTEALALEVPDYPRADGAELGKAVFTEPGKDALTDETAKPFAGLAALKDKLGDAG